MAASAGNGGNGNSGNSGNAGQGQSTSTGTGNTSNGTSSSTSTSASVGTSGNEGTSASTNGTSENEGTSTTTNTTTTAPSYNKQGVDANGLTKSGKQGDRNGDGKISAGESFVNNFGNWAYDVGQKANSFFGGADENGNTKAGRAADRNGDGKISVVERVSNMFNNLGTNINQTFGGVNYQGKNKSGEQVVAPGEHVNFNQRMTNLGHNFLSRNGKSWSDTNNNGVMDGNELGRAAAINAATFGFNLVPVFGKALSDFATGAATGKSNSIAGQLGASFGEGGNTNTNNNISYSGSTLSPLKEKEEIEKPNNNFIKRIKRLDISSLPAVTSTYIKRGEEKTPAITVSDEELKSFALRFYRQKTIK